MDLKDKRVRLKLSQLRLARRAGVSRFKLCLYELGEGTLNPREIALLESAIAEETRRVKRMLGEVEGKM